MADIPLKLDENNTLEFSVDITGDEPVQGAPIIRFVCESKDVSYVFEGKYVGGNDVEVEVPPMKGKLKEGTYQTKLEVILEDRYFCPLELEAEFKVSRKVVAEIKQRKKPEPKQADVKASFVTQSSTPASERKPAKAEQKQPRRRGSLKNRYKKGLL